MAASTARDVMIAAGAGVASAALFLGIFFGSFGLVLAYVALLPLLLLGLGWGLQAMAISMAIGTAIAVGLTSLVGGVMYALIYAVPATAIVWLGLRNRPGASQAVEWYPIGQLVARITIYGCGVLTVLALMGGDSGVKEALAQFEAMMATMLPAHQNQEVAALVRTIAGIWLAITIFSWMVMVVVNAVLAQGLLERFRRNLRPGPSYAEIALPEWYAAVTVAGAVAALVAPMLDAAVFGFAARNVALALLGPYLLVGLAVVHVVARRWPARPLILAGFYLLLLVFGWIGFLLVAGLGFIEQWLFLRWRFAAGHSQEDEQ